MNASFTDVFVRRPVLAIVISLVLLLLGGFAFTRLGVKETPSVEAPVVTVTTTWPGADPAIVESDVTEVLERQLNGIEGVRTISSISREQVSTITVEFVLSRPLEEAANDVRAKVGLARRDLPQEAEEPIVEKSDADAQPVMFIQLSQEGRSLLELTDLADQLLRERLQTIPGVSNVQIFGEQRFAMRIELDPLALAARGLTVTDIQNALRAGNVDAPAGRVEGATTELSVRVEAGLRTPEEFAGLVVSARDGELVHLGDVATIRLGAENERSAARSDGVPAITVAIAPQANSNILQIADEVYRRLPRIEEDLPEGASIHVNYDRTIAVRSSIREVEETLVIAFGLVVLVIFAFLRDLRSTLVPTLAIPVSLVGTALFLWAAGFTINVFTLFGLVLAIGLVVDDAIVVLENVHRRMEEGEGPFEAALNGTRQIVFAVLATTISLVAVFVPVIFSGGTSGRLFLEFGSTVAVSVALSALVALTLTPALCAILLRPSHGTGLVHRLGERVLGWMNRVFAATLGAVARAPVVVVPIVLLALVGGWLGFTRLPREFFPIEDRSIIFMRTLAPEGSGFAWMDARMAELEPELIEAVPDRRVILTRVASGPGGVSAAANSGQFVVILKPKEERERSQQEVVADLRKRFAAVTAFQIVPIQFPTVGRSLNPPFQFVIQNPSFEALAGALPDVVQAFRQIPGLTGVSEDLRLNRPELRVHVDREKAAALGVPIADVARALQILTSNLELAQFKHGSRSYAVLVGLRPERRDTPGDLGQIDLRSASGAMVPLGNLVSFEEGSGASARYHYDRSPSATISANLDGITLGEAIDRARAVADQVLPPGFRTALAGESRDYADSTSGLGVVFGLAIVLVYLTLAAQFDSFVDPISILMAVPLALAGAFLGLWLVGMTLSFFSQVGLILLVGLVAKNGILIVEYAHQLEHERGLDRWASALEAAKLRFRPILMTSVATIGGAVPIALGFSSESRAPLGVTVVAGMLVATALSLLVTPVLYAALGSFADRFGGRRRAAVVAAALAVAPATSEGAPLTLRDALATADAQNLDVLALRSAVDLADANVDLARAGVLPSLGGSADASYGTGTDGSGFSVSGAARLTVPLVDVAGWSDVRAARLRLEATAADTDATREDVLAAVAARFVEAQRAQEALTAAESLVALSERLQTLAEDRVSVGVAAPIEAKRAQVQRVADGQRVLAARLDRDAAWLRLAQILGVPVSSALDVAPAEALPPVEGEGTLEDRPDLRAARAQAEAATADRRAAARAFAPELDGFGQGSVSGVPGGTSTYGAEAGIEATFSLFGGGARTAALRGSRAAESAAALSAGSVERAADVEIQVADRTVAQAGPALAAAHQLSDLAREEVALAEDRFRSGAATNVEVVQAQSRLSSALLAEVDALAAWNLAIIDWYRARGRLAELATPE